MSTHSTRQQDILEILQTMRECSIQDLVSKFGVSGMTVRRDLEILADQGRIVRTHGGAVLAPGVTFEFAFLRRTKLNQAQKRMIGRMAAALVKDGQAVLLDSGTTTVAIAEQLRQGRNIKVITTSLPIASMLQYSETVELNLLGGQLRAGSPDLCGALTESNLEMIRPDVAFVGATAIDANGAIFTESATLSRLLARMVSCANRAYVVADSSKLGGTALWRYGHLKDVAGLITDDQARPAFVAGLVRRGITVLRPSRAQRQAT